MKIRVTDTELKNRLVVALEGGMTEEHSLLVKLVMDLQEARAMDSNDAHDAEIARMVLSRNPEAVRTAAANILRAWSPEQMESLCRALCPHLMKPAFIIETEGQS